ncbi:hypothetical protein N9M17_00195 [bacterium]|nr:hypothetical protein [bacterium]MDB4741161.1 hypothetical protein [Akkermansiaceae bacterium]
MSDFDDVIRPSTPEPEPVKQTQSVPQSEAKSLVEMLTADGDLNSLGQQLNLDGDMTEKVLVPLVNFLDKYGVGESVSTNPTVSRATGMLGFLTDVAPVLRSAAEYFQGRRNDLSAEDEAFLERIREAQDTGTNTDLFVGTEIGESAEEPEPEPVVQTPRPANPFTDGPMDWDEILGVPKHAQNSDGLSGLQGTYSASAKKTNFGISGIEALAQEAGVSMNDITNDRQSRTNGTPAADYSNGAPINVLSGMDEIQRAMQSEQKKISNTSKVNFAANDLETPDSLSSYTPNATIPEPAPALGVLQSVDDLMKDYGISAEEMESPAGTPTESEELEDIDDEDLEFDESSNTYRHRETGEIYEAVDLTEVPDDYFGS